MDLPLSSILEAMNWALKNINRFPTIPDLRLHIEGDPNDHAETAWRTLCNLGQVGAEHTIVFTDPVFGQTVIDCWGRWSNVIYDFKHTEGPAIAWELKKPFILKYLTNYQHRQQLVGPTTLPGKPHDYTRHIYTYTVTGGTYEQTAVETRRIPTDPAQPGDEPTVEPTDHPFYQKLLEYQKQNETRLREAYAPAAQHRAQLSPEAFEAKRQAMLASLRRMAAREEAARQPGTAAKEEVDA